MATHSYILAWRIPWTIPLGRKESDTTEQISLLFSLFPSSVQSLSCVWLCDPMDCSPPCSSVHGISQARILEWVAYSFSSRSSQPRNWTRVSCIAGGFFNNWAMNLTNSRKKTEGTQGWTKIGEKKGLSPYLHIQILASWIYIFKLWNQSQAN